MAKPKRPSKTKKRAIYAMPVMQPDGVLPAIVHDGAAADRYELRTAGLGRAAGITDRSTA